MIINKVGRKQLGDRKRKHTIMLRFNTGELEKVKALLRSYNVDFQRRGAVGPFLRRLILNKQAEKSECLPGNTPKVRYQLNKIGTNINQLVKVAHYKNRRSPNASLVREVQKANELITVLITTINNTNLQ
ncbi:plasmid mobilization relaxosome protein MobC [Arenibacter sp. 6A1]|uniref:plasmid mobilization relaxosome protein MobC n=1 Tax=Arenibacter sp. 6A1 TaxID=2720391 RepID=UPI001445CA7B|nr:plasmid mobilization relaxosome protein MobC [Arenibacter sp. 6A1]NKI27882.1 plasmid mobilization relaxosome protein MobC [Arenibacter sp. 6A1]